MTPNRSQGEWTLAVRQQAAVAHLGQLSLQAADLEEVLRESMVAAADTLDLSDAGLFELLPGGAALRGRAGLLDGALAGRETVGRVQLPVDERSLPGFAVIQGKTVVTPDIHADDRFRARAEEFSFPGRAAIAAPIGWDERPIGVLLVYDRSERSWTEDEVHFVQAVANTMGLAIQRSRVERDLRDSSARLDVSLSAGGLGAWSWEVDNDHVELSPTALELFGLTGGGFAGTALAFLALVHPDDRERFSHEVLATLEPAGEQHLVLRLIRPDNGEVRWIESWGRQLHTEAAGFHLVGVCSDVTDRRHAEALQEALLRREHEARVEAEAARERLGFLAGASALLSQSLDPTVTLERIAELCVPGLAEVCFIDLVDDDGALVEHAARGATVERLASAQALRERRRQLGASSPTPTGHREALLGQAVIYPAISIEHLRAASFDDDHLALYQQLDARSTILAPLISRGRTIGVLTLIRTGEGAAAYHDDDQALVEELASRAAMAIDNGRLYASRARVARSLQAALLPPALPAIAGLSIAARYDVAEADVAIGGDFYDVIALGSGAWGVVVGDVCGRGPDAAALTGLVRHTLRTAVVREHQPSRVLRQTNEAMLQQIDDASFCTAAYLHVEVLDAAAGGVRVVASSAGHPRPVLVRASGEVVPLDCAGTLLGVVEAPRLHDVDLQLAADDAVVLYTDGVTEARRGDDLFGEDRVLRVLAGLAGETAEAMAAGLEGEVASFRRSARDDTAILVLRATASA
jgi:PAS domain S-box-containing protein